MALNGLLPRRGPPQDFGRSEWTDLAWLLELNQGSYNAAALAAAVCNINDDKAEAGLRLGEPTLSVAGNERLEPMVNAFPFCRKGAEPKTASEQRLAGHRANGQKYMKGRLVELNSGLCVGVVVLDQPLADPGPLDPGKKLPAYFQATKVGMANFPPWILNQMDAGGGATILVGSPEKPEDEETPIVPRARGDTNV
ncbi:hypothetical protein C8J57DRAFT_1483288 [Mycena rebaudengoi]|nr:hypothetical protein C8J57DRAFT_1483288 [Mycena rebaudengoi]